MTIATIKTIKQDNLPLREAVKKSLDNYFAQLGNESVKDVYDMVLAEIEAPLLETIMKHTGGNQSRAAILLGLSRGTLRKKLKIYDIRETAK